VSPTDLSVEAQRGIEELYNSEAQTIFRTVNAIVLNPATAQDLTQETFVRAMRAWDRFDQRNPRGWLLKIASNLAISHYRTEKRRRAVPPWQLIIRRRETAPEEADDRDLVSWLMRPLNADQRALIVLHYYHQVSRTEIAEMLGIPVGTVASRINKAMTVMRQRAVATQEFGTPPSSSSESEPEEGGSSESEGQ
jgi:RNA polymerase sigma-70 factor, ECF subfamily